MELWSPFAVTTEPIKSSYRADFDHPPDALFELSMVRAVTSACFDLM